MCLHLQESLLLATSRGPVLGNDEALQSAVLLCRVEQSLKPSRKQVNQHLSEKTGAAVSSKVGDESDERDSAVLLVVPIVPERVLDTTEVVDHLLGSHEVLSALEGETALQKWSKQGL